MMAANLNAQSITKKIDSANAAEKIFSILGDSVKIKNSESSTFTITELVCKVGRGVECNAKLLKNIEIKIKNPELFFEILKESNAISLIEERLGGNIYKLEKLSCSFQSKMQPYYLCRSLVKVKF